MSVVQTFSLLGGPFDGATCDVELEDPSETWAETLEIGFPWAPKPVGSADELVVDPKVKIDWRFSTTYSSRLVKQEGAQALAMYAPISPAPSTLQMRFTRFA